MDNQYGAIFMRNLEEYKEYEIGEWTYGSPSILAWGEGKKLRIGKFCSIAEGVTIMLGGEHRSDWVTTYPFNPIFPNTSHIKGHPKSKGDVIIGNDVWIGREALILSGVTISDGVVVGARSVVTRDIPPYAIVAGNPAKIIRYRFKKKEIKRLLEIKWWEWEINNIKDNVEYLMNNDIKGFIKKYYEC